MKYMKFNRAQLYYVNSNSHWNYNMGYNIQGQNLCEFFAGTNPLWEYKDESPVGV